MVKPDREPLGSAYEKTAQDGKLASVLGMKVSIRMERKLQGENLVVPDPGPLAVKVRGRRDIGRGMRQTGRVNEAARGQAAAHGRSLGVVETLGVRVGADIVGPCEA